MGIRDDYANKIKDAAVTMGTGSAMTALVTQLPVFANPFLNYIAREALEHFISFLVKKGEMAAFFSYVDLRVNQQGRDFADAVTRWQTAPPEEKAEREREFKKAFRDLVVLNVGR